MIAKNQNNLLNISIGQSQAHLSQKSPQPLPSGGLVIGEAWSRILKRNNAFLKQTARSLSLPSVIFTLRNICTKPFWLVSVLESLVLPWLPIIFILHWQRLVGSLPPNNLFLKQTAPSLSLPPIFNCKDLFCLFAFKYQQLPSLSFQCSSVLSMRLSRGLHFFLQNLKSKYNCKDLFWLFAFKRIDKFHAVEIKIRWCNCFVENTFVEIWSFHILCNGFVM